MEVYYLIVYLHDVKTGADIIFSLNLNSTAFEQTVLQGRLKRKHFYGTFVEVLILHYEYKMNPDTRKQ